MGLLPRYLELLGFLGVILFNSWVSWLHAVLSNQCIAQGFDFVSCLVYKKFVAFGFVVDVSRIKLFICFGSIIG